VRAATFNARKDGTFRMAKQMRKIYVGVDAHGRTHHAAAPGLDHWLTALVASVLGGVPGPFSVGGIHALTFRRHAADWPIGQLTIQLTFCAQFDTVEPRTAFLGKPPTE